jgi:hypothetical protein
LFFFFWWEFCDINNFQYYSENLADCSQNLHWKKTPKISQFFIQKNQQILSPEKKKKNKKTKKLGFF